MDMMWNVWKKTGSKTGSRTGRVVTAWFLAVLVLLLAWFVLSPPSLSAHLAVFIWIFSGLVVLFLARKGDLGKTIKDWEMYAAFALGIFFCILSFFWVQIGLGNPPYSIDDFSILLSGVTLILFSAMKHRRLLLASALPLVAVVAFQVYDKTKAGIEALAEPLIPPVSYLSISMLNLLGVGAVADGNRIMLTSLQGKAVGIVLVFDCTGVESMATFLLAAAIVFYLFRDMPKRKKGLFLAVGVIGTYISNILRVVVIALSGYHYGPTGMIELTHLHSGWMIFTAWMLVFWYAFFASYMKGLKKKQQHRRPGKPAKGAK